MKNKIKQILDNILNSFNNSPDGYSLKKLTAFITLIFGFISPIIVWEIYAYKYKDFTLLIGVLGVVSSFVLVVLGIHVYQESKKDNNDNAPQ